MPLLQLRETNEPSHGVFKGAVGALTCENSLTSEVGETVLVIHSQANRDTRPHMIGAFWQLACQNREAEGTKHPDQPGDMFFGAHEGARGAD